MKILGVNVGKLFMDDIAAAKTAIAKGQKEAIRTETADLNSVIKGRPSSVRPFEATATTITCEADIALLPGSLPILVREIAPKILHTDNVFREAYSAAKRLNIDSSLVRANLKAVLEAAMFLANAQTVLGKRNEEAANKAAKIMADRLAEGFDR